MFNYAILLQKRPCSTQKRILPALTAHCLFHFCMLMTTIVIVLMEVMSQAQRPAPMAPSTALTLDIKLWKSPPLE